MAYTLSLAEARNEVIYLAALDGKTGANARHSPTRLDSVLNRKYRALLSRVGQLGLPHGLSSATGTLSGPLAGEDFISLTVPSAAAEIVGVDVRGASTGSQRWQKLDPISFEQRRDICIEESDYRHRPGGLLPPHGVGFWTFREGPSVSGETLSTGSLAVWPSRLGGASYTVHYVRKWVDISDDAEVFLMHDGWDEWFLNAAAMACAQRDSNKRTNYDTARDAWLAADALLEAEGARLQRAGTFSPTPYGGLIL